MKISKQQCNQIINMLIGQDLNHIFQHCGCPTDIKQKFLGQLEGTVNKFMAEKMNGVQELGDQVEYMQFLYQELWSMTNDFRCATAVRMMNEYQSSIIKPKAADVINLQKGKKK